jgi:alpha-beta hydrolase superfamily lysophospholipase
MHRIIHAAVGLLGRALAAAGLAAVLAQCSHEVPVAHRYQQPRLGPDRFVSADGESFGYRKWLASDPQAETIVVGIHGFCGAAIDYENLGRHMVDQRPANAVYAYELRGQGNDPVRERRGDIDDPDNWYRDLYTFTALLREQHPGARIVWFGESMGALIAVQAYARSPDPAKPPCDALVLSSPITKIRDDFPQWKKIAVRVVAAGLPKARVSLETLTGGQPLQMTHDTVHAEQSETNSWHIERHTLRLLVSLGDLVDDMQVIAPRIRVPTLVMHAGHDFASRPEDVREFFARLPANPVNRRLYFPDSHHLLMYDRDRERVISGAAGWIDALRR